MTAGTVRTSLPTRALLLLLAMNLLNYIDRQVLAAVVPSIRTEFFNGASSHTGVTGVLLSWMQALLNANPENAMIGLLAMSFMVVYMISAPIAGWLSVSRWRMVAAGCAIWSIATLMSGMATGFGMLILSRCLLGVGVGGFGPIAPTILSSLFPENERGRKMSLFYLAIPVGSALGFVLGGTVGASSLGWRWAFYLAVVPGILLALAALYLGRQDNVSTKEEASDKRSLTLADYKAIVFTPSYLYTTLGMTASTFALGAIGFWMPSYVHEFRGVGNLAQVNVIFGAILVVSGLLATISGGYLADRLKPRYPGSYFLVSAAGMLASFPLFVGALYVPFPSAWVLLFLACFGVFLNTGPTFAIMANVTHPTLRAGAFALNILIIHAFGDVISPIVIGAITDATGSMNVAFLTVAATVLVAGIFWLLGAPHLERDTAKANSRQV